MLSYRHGYHAGSWADVHKHAALMLLLAHLCRKPKPFCVIDAFAGDGLYDLGAPEALKTGEFKQGIARIYGREDAPAGVALYLSAIQAHNADNSLATYPGSPPLSLGAMRDDDRLILCEQHPTAHSRLMDWAGRDGRVAIHRRDGFEALKALLPPPIRRGLVLIDPSYEVKTDYDAVPKAVAEGLARWPAGIFAIWYPVLAEGRHLALVKGVAALAAERSLLSEIGPREPPATGLQGAGMIIVNPPWQFDRDMRVAGDWLALALWPAPGGRHTLRWLTGAAGRKTR